MDALKEKLAEKLAVELKIRRNQYRYFEELCQIYRDFILKNAKYCKSGIKVFNEALTRQS